MTEKTYYVTKHVLATRSKRFITYIIDYLAIYGIIFIGIVVLFFISEQTGWPDENWLNGLENTSQLLEILIYVLVAVPYYYFFELFTQRTPGKFLTGTLVVDKEGNKPLPKSLLKRTLFRMVPFDGISFLASDSLGWHDRYSETYVADKQKFTADKSLFNELHALGNQETV